jgi:hypothetical protein
MVSYIFLPTIRPDGTIMAAFVPSGNVIKLRKRSIKKGLQ